MDGSGSSGGMARCHTGFAAGVLLPPAVEDAGARPEPAADGDEVVLASGAYYGNGNRDLDFRGKAITVRSTDPNNSAVAAATMPGCLGTPNFSLK